jgi:hypothetical protein
MMRNALSILLYCTAAGFAAVPARAQLPAIGQWRVQIPYNNPKALQDGGDEVFVANDLSVYRYQKSDGAISRLSKVNLLSDIGVRDLHYHAQRDALLIAYTNSNVDVLQGETVFNFPFIRTQNIVGDKNIYGVEFKGDTAYLACGFGLLVLDIRRRESPATYFFSTSAGTPIRVNDVAVFDDTVYAATAQGLFRVALSDPLPEDFSRWEALGSSSGLPAGEVDEVLVYAEQLHARSDNTLLVYDGSGWMPWYDAGTWTIRSLSPGDDYLLITEYSGPETSPDSNRILVWEGDVLQEVLQDDLLVLPTQARRDASGEFWIADRIRGLIRWRNASDRQIVNPDGPQSSAAFAMAYGAGRLFVAPGSVNNSWNKLFNRDGFFSLGEFGWNNVNRFNQPAMDSVTDVLAVAVDPQNGTAWLGSFGDGLLEYRADGSLTIYKQNSALQGATGDFSNYRVAGVGLDERNGNLWMANNGAARPVVVRTPANDWYSFNSGLPALAGEGIVQCVVDNFGQVWFAVIRGGGILVFDPGSDLVNTADDRRKNLGLGAGNGNLPTTAVLCLAKDRDGVIWAGTEEGVAVFFNPGAVLQPGTAGDASQIIVELDGFPAILLEDEAVRAIAVDGANRKWIGTNNGVFLLSADGLEQLAHFTAQNSPLLDNRILSLAVDGQSGEVYIGTELGIVAYRGEATEGGPVHEDVYVFPNPVREDYEGPIAIRGLVQDADVRITDASGRMVYATQALGGQAIWDGRRVDNGERAATGVYLVFSTDRLGQEKLATKFLMVRGGR